MKEEAFSISDRSESGAQWETISFDQWASKMHSNSKPYQINPFKYLRSVKQEFIQNLGVKKGKSIFFKAIFWDFLFKKPQWAPAKFNLTKQKTKDVL